MRITLFFEHLVQVNDLSRSDIADLSRQQLWQGLVWRAREPNNFIVGLEEFSIRELAPDHLARTLHLPGVRVEDEVRLTPMEKICYRIKPSERIAGGELTMTIEEPEDNALFVRFSYRTLYMEPLGTELEYEEYVKQAYVAADIESITLIRERCSHVNPQQGSLDGHYNKRQGDKH